MRKQHEEEERSASLAPAQAILDALNDTIAVIDPDGTISAVNAAWRRMARESCPPDRLERTGIGMNYLQVCWDAQGVSHEGAKEAGRGIQAVLARIQSYFTLEYPCFSPTRQSWYLMQVSPLTHNKGAVVIHIDITERKRHELALQDTNARFDVFLSMASHELKTPLAGISGNIQLALRRLEKIAREGRARGDDEIIQWLRDPLEQALQRVTVQDRMITDLLDTSRIRANQLSIVTRPSNLVEIVRHAVNDIRYLAPERTIHVNLPETEIIPIVADADRIGQVVSNYLSNALKYSATNRPVQISLTRDTSTTRVSVKDKGPGLTPEEQTMVWERFHRIKGIPVHTNTGGDLGLGLYLCHVIIKRHGGHVGVSSTKGEGSTFWFTLPLACEP